MINTRVLDLTRLLPGPYGTCLLGDLGADVIKVEKPGEGDYLRDLYSDEEDVSHYFQMVNRNKRSLELDLKDEIGLDIFYKLVRDADVVIESFRPGVAERLDVDYETLRQINNSLVYCSLSGYGQDGTYSNIPGHDPNYLAVSGLLHLNGEEKSPPKIPSMIVGDFAGGTFLCIAVLASLLDDESRYVDISISDILTTWSLPFIYKLFEGGDPPRRGHTRLQKYPSTGVYQTKDGRALCIAAIEKKFWRQLCELLYVSEFIHDHHSESQETRRMIEETLSEIFLLKNRSEWMDYFSDKNVPVSPVNKLDNLPESDYVKSRNLIVDEEDYGKQFRFPLKMGKDVNDFRKPAPKLGEHTDEILSEIDISPREIRKLHADNII